LQLTYTSPLFEQALVDSGLDTTTRERIVQQVVEKGNCQAIDGLPEQISEVFVVSSDITAEEHVRMQAALQAFVDNSLSKTINFPAGATVEDVATAYRLAWELGAKGITVYVTGSREVVVLETHQTAEAKQQEEEQLVLWNETKKPRPRYLEGSTYHVETPVGKAFVTINRNGGNQPFEVFLNTAKAGSETAAVSEAIGRLISYILRLSSPVAPRKRLREIYRQLVGIGGGRSLGFGPNRVRSLPDGVAHALAEYLESTDVEEEDPPVSRQNGGLALKAFTQHEENGASEHKAHQVKGDLCPECGHAAVIAEEGCRKCYNCGFSEC
jgi:ribonucleoside-diphosphate reductase alpha chain